MSQPPSPTQQRPKDPLQTWLWALPPCLFLLVAVRTLWPHTLDDAYISMQYARNFITGNGLVFNPGEHVEGFSNPLWVFLLALGGWVAGWSFWAKLLGSLCACATLLVTGRWVYQLTQDIEENDHNAQPPTKKPTRKKGKHKKGSKKARDTTPDRHALWEQIPAFLAASLLVIHPGVGYYAIAGLETSLFALLVLLGAVLHLHDVRTHQRPSSLWCYLPLSAAALTRPEGPLFLVLIAAHRLWLRWHNAPQTRTYDTTPPTKAPTPQPEESTPEAETPKAKSTKQSNKSSKKKRKHKAKQNKQKNTQKADKEAQTDKPSVEPSQKEEPTKATKDPNEQAQLTEPTAPGWMPTKAWLALGAAFGGAGLWWLIRWLYYGSLLPNTYYAKPATFLEFASQGTTYMKTFFHYHVQGPASGPQWLELLSSFGGMLLGGCLLLLSLLALLYPPVRREARFLLFTFVLYATFIFYVGGDWMTQHRFFQPVLPLLYIVPILGLLSLSGQVRTSISILLLVLIVSHSRHALSFWHTIASNKVVDHAHSSKNNVRMARWLAKRLKANSTIVTDEIGAVGFYSGLKVIDQLGLVDKTIARILHKHHFNPYNSARGTPHQRKVQTLIAKEILKRKPDYVLLDYVGKLEGNQPYNPRMVNNMTMRQLFNEIRPYYIYVRAFNMMAFPPKSFLLFRRDTPHTKPHEPPK